MIEQYLRNAAHVNRWAIVRTTRKQSIAEHMYFVSVIVMRLVIYLLSRRSYLVLRLAAILQAALTHDLDETITGDVPTPVKRAGLSDAVASRFLEVLPWASDIEDGPLNDDEKAVLKVADYLEALLFLREEQTLGNTQVQGHIDYVKDRLDTHITEHFNPQDAKLIRIFVSESDESALDPMPVIK